MAVYFPDTSAAVKHYLSETGSNFVDQIFDNLNNIIFVARITSVEMVSAVRRRAAGGTISTQEAQNTNRQIRTWVEREAEVFELTEEVAARAMDLAETYVLRGYDAIQLASACEVNEMFTSQSLGNVIFLCADNALLDAARHEGLQTENPNNHP